MRNQNAQALELDRFSLFGIVFETFSCALSLTPKCLSSPVMM